MSEKRLEEIDRDIRKLNRVHDDLEKINRQGGSTPSRLLERSASSLGFERPKKRTGEPIWVHSDGYTTAITSHPAVRITTRKKIVANLQDAIFRMKERLNDERALILKQKNQFGSRYE